MTVLKLGMTIKNLVAGINANFTELSNKLTYKPISYKILYSGFAAIPSKDSGSTATITLNDSITKFDGIIIQREGSSCWQSIQTITTGSVFKVMNCESDFDMMEGCNLYLCNAEVVSGTQLKVSNNVYAGIKTNASGRYLASFSDRPVTRVIGIKLN